MNFRTLGGFGVGLGFLLTPAAAQNVVSYLAATPAIAATGESAANWARMLQVPSFNRALGTLTQAKLTWVSTVQETLQLENLSGADGSFSYRLTTSLALTLGRTPWLATTANTATGSGVVGAFDGIGDFSGASSFGFGRTGTSVEQRVESGAALEKYLAPGGLGFLATATTLAAIEGPGNFLSFTTSNAAVRLELEYTYTPIPEPEGYAVLIGVLGFGVVLLRRGRNRPRAAGSDASAIGSRWSRSE